MWELFDYVDDRGINIIEVWRMSLQKPERAKLDNRLNILAKTGPEGGTGLLAGTKSRHIDKLKVTGKVTLRLMLCRGPVEMDGEFTLLLGAHEQDRKLVPRNAEKIAEEHRLKVISNPTAHRSRRYTRERNDPKN
jgi:hypothetical protein